MTELKDNSYFCPFCGEQILKNARICRFCQNNVTYDLYVFKIPGDQRRGEIARRIFESTQTKFFPSFGTIRKALENDDDPFVVNVVQEDIDSLTRILADFDIGFEQGPHEAKPLGNFRKHMLIVGACLGVMLVAFFYFSRRIKPVEQEMASSETFQVKPETQSAENSGNEIKTQPPLSQEARTNIENLLISTATIFTRGGSGSAFFVSREGHLVSNEHVTKSAKEVEVLTYDGRRHKGVVLKIQSHYDLSLIKIDSPDYPPLQLGDATKLHQGDTVWTIGAPSGLEFSVTKGIASYVGRNVGGKAFIQADVAINPGNSGGPMINDSGEVIGINNFIIKQTVGLNFAIPVNYLYSGSDPILKNVVDTIPDSGKMLTWRSWENANTATMEGSSTEPENHNSTITDNSSPDVSGLLKQLKDSESLLQNVRDKMDREFQALDQKINKLTTDYANESTVSVQEKIGLEIRRLKVQQIDTELKKIDAFLQYNKTASGLMVRAKQLSMGDNTKTSHYDSEIAKLVQSKSESETNRAQLVKRRQALLN